MSDTQAPPGPMDFMTGGWGAVEGNQPTPEDLAEQEAQQQELSQQRRDEDKAFHAVFTKGRGPEVLQMLRDMTIEQPCFNPEAGENAAAMGFTREGQNSVVREIEARIVRAQETPNAPRRKAPKKKGIS